MKICIAGKNEIAIEAVKHLIDIGIKKDSLLALCNFSDKGINEWQPSFRKFCQLNNIEITNLQSLYDLKNLIFISLEYDRLIKTENFKTESLFNIHFSALPEYKGVYTSILPILHGKSHSGVTLHKIDDGIDTGEIIAQEIFEIKENWTAYDLYLNYISHGILLFKNNIVTLLNSEFVCIAQANKNSSYYSRKCIDFGANLLLGGKTSYQMANSIRSLSFRPFQLPKINDVNVINCYHTDERSTSSFGKVLWENDFKICLSTIDYNLIIIKDKLKEILEAAKRNEYDKLKSFYFNGLNFSERNNFGWNALMVACFNGSAECVNVILELQPELVNSRGFNGTTPLMYAASNYQKTKNVEILTSLLDNGANILMKDYSNLDVFDYHTNLPI